MVITADVLKCDGQSVTLNRSIY